MRICSSALARREKADHSIISFKYLPKSRCLDLLSCVQLGQQHSLTRSEFGNEDSQEPEFAKMLSVEVKQSDYVASWRLDRFDSSI